MNDYADLIWRLENGADRFLKWTYNEPYSGAPVISIPRHPDNIDALLTEAAACIREMVEWRDRTKIAYAKSNDQVCQSLGKALGYPWFKDDQVNFPRSTEADGVCVGEHVAESIADEAAKIITETTQWRDISTFTGSGQNESVMVAVPNSEGGFIVGEAWRCVMAEDDDYRGLSGWWWAGTAPGDYNHDPIRDMNHGDPTHWLPLPPAPGAEA
ncbi:hypothetical protein [Brevundimonas diminuta]|uniref:hypothetical protein n=1 Tax=Brevundimonas diminuta TaxID=293 RepID=UPI000207ED09|nr:hypothetical protein [Brevundimonas diminuta]EGF96795.1 hypothetical protein BDIM_06030 [Brevundimonas diminuta ATCC 11568]OWR16561.1 hypothetical protein CD944_16200 [Brevundimonas diminuta]WQE44831.1 hypothetical protein U0020_14725 [Brevundimonas diminuta]SUW17345.1 Uncharacterised protein [Brevundimonas diminuta]SUW85815.1 Uncharacterised protein [Brevundimonas diminuta]